MNRILSTIDANFRSTIVSNGILNTLSNTGSFLTQAKNRYI